MDDENDELLTVASSFIFPSATSYLDAEEGQDVGAVDAALPPWLLSLDSCPCAGFTPPLTKHVSNGTLAEVGDTIACFLNACDMPFCKNDATEFLACAFLPAGCARFAVRIWRRAGERAFAVEVAWEAGDRALASTIYDLLAAVLDDPGLLTSCGGILESPPDGSVVGETNTDALQLARDALVRMVSSGAEAVAMQGCMAVARLAAFTDTPPLLLDAAGVLTRALAATAASPSHSLDTCASAMVALSLFTSHLETVTECVQAFTAGAESSDGDTPHDVLVRVCYQRYMLTVLINMITTGVAFDARTAAHVHGVFTTATRSSFSAVRCEARRGLAAISL